MPWKNLFNDAISFFVDSMAFLRGETAGKSALSAIYNTLEQDAIEAIERRSGKGAFK